MCYTRFHGRTRFSNGAFCVLFIFTTFLYLLMMLNKYFSTLFYSILRCWKIMRQLMRLSSDTYFHSSRVVLYGKVTNIQNTNDVNCWLHGYQTFKLWMEVVLSPRMKERMPNEPSSVTTWTNLKVTDQKG